MYEVTNNANVLQKSISLITQRTVYDLVKCLIRHMHLLTKESFLLIHIRNKFDLQLLTESDVTECYHIKYLAYFLHFFTIDECRLNRGMES